MADLDPASWLARLQARAADLSPPAELALRIEQRFDDEAVWHVVIADGEVTVAAGPDPDADVSVATSREVAARLAAGDGSAQRAFLDGDLRVGGDIAALLANREALAQLGALLRAT
ncbi:MAG: SCP2 sterol-binding domain-containing protein [Acidimicrobiales bacterium]|nr:SCP2 sterol-binding domain-containing protein [Acidimicrobiales bacterium]